MTTSPATALITGASSGIGEALAHQLAQKGSNLILVARSEDKLNALSQQLSQQYGITAYVIGCDLSLANAGETLEKAVNSLGLSVDILVNNAGFGGYSEFEKQNLDEIHNMLNVNIVALTDLTRRFLPQMAKRGRGRILNIASTAAFMPGPLMAVYYASKAYVLSFSEAVNEEMRGTGVSVTTLCPGPVETGFQAVSKLGESKLLESSNGIRQLTLLSADQVAKIGVDAMLRGQAVVIAGLSNQIQVLVPRFVPRGLMPRIIAKIQGRK